MARKKPDAKAVRKARLKRWLRKALGRQTGIKTSRFNKWSLLATVLVFSVAGVILLLISRAEPVVVTVKSGSWSDPAIWNTGKVPLQSEGAQVTSGHTVIVSADVRAAGIRVQRGASLVLNPVESVVVESSANVIIEGLLAMKPSSPSVNHTLRFINIDETKVVGGGMNPLATDIGLWVMEAGKLEAVGSPRSGWLKAAQAIPQGATGFTLSSDPVGWRVGDEVSIAPTAAGTATQFDIRTISAISGRTVTLASGTTFAHPTVNTPDGKTHTAEVMNLTRNVNIEGTKPAYRYPRAGKENTSGGRAHIFIRNTEPVSHTIKHIGIRYMGPRKSNAASATSVRILGRYGLHLHMSGENNDGLIVEGTVIRDTDSHAYVPHLTNGITFRDTVAFDTTETAYWWDVKSNEQAELTNDPTHRITYDKTIAAKVDVDYRGDTRLAGYSFTNGTGNIMKNTVAVGILGRVQASGYLWPEGANGGFNVWRFDENNLAHNNLIHGIFTWQNDGDHHVIRDFTAYHNGSTAIDHGAYQNRFLYGDIVAYENGWNTQLSAEIRLHSNNGAATGTPQTIRDVLIDTSLDYALASVFHRLPAPEGAPTRLANWKLQRYAKKAVMINELGDSGESAIGDFDLVCWTLPGGRELEPSDFEVRHMTPGIFYRIQRRNGTAYRLNADGTATTIAKFADCPAPMPPDGQGTGLRGMYFNNPDFTDPVGDRVDPLVKMYWNVISPFPGVDPESYSVRWTGQMQPHYTEPYTIYGASRGGMRVYIDGKLAIDDMSWHTLREVASQPINLTAGHKHDVMIEFAANAGRGEAYLSWSSARQPKDNISEFQLFPAPAGSAGSGYVIDPERAPSTRSGRQSTGTDANGAGYVQFGTSP